MQRISAIQLDGEKEFGGKAIGLARLQQAGFSVKKAEAISVNEVEDIVSSQKVPKHIIDGLEQSLVFEPHGVAVRSSAIGEDGALSWAGQFKTLLFVPREELTNAIIECANAKTSEKVKAYASMHNEEIPFLALIVQEMVNAESAGILFTINPKNNSNQMVLEAVPGISLSLADGSCQPVRYYLDPTTMEIIKQEGNVNDAMLLSNKQLAKLVYIGNCVQNLFNKPQDIEWAIERETGKLFLNQSRDITGLNMVSEIIVVEDIRQRAILQSQKLFKEEGMRLRELGLNPSRDVFSNQNIVELITSHPCQMSFGLFTYLFAHGNGAIRIARNEMGYEIGPELDTGFFCLIGGQPRCSIVHDAFTYRIQGIPLRDYWKFVEFYLTCISEDIGLANYPEIVLYEQNPSLEFLSDFFDYQKALEYQEAHRKFFAGIQDIENHITDECLNKFFPAWEQEIKRHESLGIPGDIVALSNQYHEICDALRTSACCMFVKVARLGFFGYAQLRRLFNDLFAKEAEYNLNIVTSNILPELNPSLRFNVQLAALRDGAVSIQDIISQFGHRAVHELEISTPRYHENTDFFSDIADKISDNPSRDYRDRLEYSTRLQSEILMKVNSNEREEIRKDIDNTKIYLGLREEVKFAFLKGYKILRELALQIEQKLGWEKNLIFHLKPEEIFVITKDAKRFYDSAKERCQEWKANKSLYVPPVMFTDDLISIGSPSHNDTKILRGIGVTNFATEGEVVVIHDLHDKQALAMLNRGSIFVAKETDPSWSSAISIVGSGGGLITEVGGLLAHAAVCAREIGMAAVLNVANVTNILKTGMKVRINGVQGYIEIL